MSEQWCDKHWNEVRQRCDVPLAASIAMIEVCVNHEEFYEIAYRIKNGYGPPEQFYEDDDWDVPEGERPDEKHIQATLEELSPLCCWLAERDEFETVIEVTNNENRTLD